MPWPGPCGRSPWTPGSPVTSPTPAGCTERPSPVSSTVPFEPGALERFVAIKETDLPDQQPIYLLFGVERGEEFCGAVPNDAIAARGRALLTIEEGIAVITQFPEVLVKNKCFSLGGSRSGDRRVPAIWISQHAPELGWCWERNPHTWLGMAAAAHRSSGR